MCTKQDQDREKGIQPPVSHALSDHHIGHGVRPRAPCQELKFLFVKHELHVNR